MRANAMIQRCQRLLGDPFGDFHKTETLLEHLNTSLAELADRARYLHMPAYLHLVEGQAWYTLPENFLSTDLVVMRGVPDPLSHTPFAQVLPWTFADTYKGTPQCFDIFGNGADERFTATVDSRQDPLDTIYVSFEDSTPGTFRRGDLIINTTNANAVAELVDGQHLSDTEYESSGGAQYQNFTGGIPGRHYFIAGDVVRVVTPNSSLKSIILSPTPDTTDVAGIESLFLFAAMRPREITALDMHNANDEMELDLELETPLQHLIMFYARLSESSADDPKVIAQQSLFETALFQRLPKIRRRVREWKSGYRQRFRQGWFRDQTIVDHTYGAGQPFLLSRADF